jgi:predicted nucleotide-binding protein
MANGVNDTQQDIKKSVFVVFGRNKDAYDGMCDFLRALGLIVIEWEQAKQMTGEGAPFVGRILEAGFKRANAIIVLLTGDDEGRLREAYRKEHDEAYEGVYTPQPRQNQIFEAGYAFGKFPKHTILVQFGHIRPFSDISGRYIPHFTGTAEDRNALRNSLVTVGCTVNDKGTAWLQAGADKFAKALVEKH